MYIKTVSPSKIKVFDECKAKYKFRYIHRLKDEYNGTVSKDALQFGQFIHKIFEDGVDTQTEEGLFEIAASIRSQYTFGQEKEKLTERCLKHFFNFNKNLSENVSTEMVFSIDTGMDFEVNGVIDRIVKGSTGKYLVIDYKTSKRPTPKRELYTDIQLRMYTYAVHKMYNIPVEDITVGHYYPHLDKLVTLKYSSSQIRMFLNEQKKKIWDIRKRKLENFPCQINQFCNWCGFKDICPAQGASPARLQEILTERKNKKKPKGGT